MKERLPLVKLRDSFEKDKNYVVGVGASAGGLEALQKLFTTIPSNTGLSFIIVLHLSPDYKSVMAELLAKCTDMKVQVAEDESSIDPNTVYVIPPGKYIILEDKAIKLLDKSPSHHAPNMAVDIFLTSLANAYKEKAIGVILSGTGSDGTRGIEAIKKNGGITIVQDPSSAKFDGMPVSAINSGFADYVLPVEEMFSVIANFLSEDIHARQLLQTGDVQDKSQEVILNNILKHVKSAQGIDFALYKRPTITRRVLRRMSLCNLTNLNDYYNYLISDEKEAENLAKEFLINVTKFFRDKEAFKEIEDKIIPEIFRNKSVNDTVKFWVVGCSTGEEAYSLAILVKEHLNRIKKDFEIKIFATDVDKEAVEFASRGLYPDILVNELSKERLENFFIKEGNTYKVSVELRKMVIFAQHDVTTNPPYNKIDLLSCRNLLIYLSPELQRKTLGILHFAINENGFLFLGPSESPESIREYLEVISKKWNIYQNVIPARTFSFENISRMAFKSDVISANSIKNILEKNYTNIVCESLAEKFDYGAVFINENYEVLEGVGNYKNYIQLPPKGLSFTILKMVPDELSIALGTTIRGAVKTQEKVSMQGVKAHYDDHERSINIDVYPFLTENRYRRKFLLVIFTQEKDYKSKRNTSDIPFNKDATIYERISDLELELHNTKQNLQTAVEQLEASNEELQSTNEELVSANEELQSTNEELQSLNEELHTVNAEHQAKIKELVELNDDMNNYFRSTHIGQIFVDNDLVIRKFTPAATQQINLIDSDIGRSITHISNNIKYPYLFDDIRTCIRSKEVIEKEVENIDGKWYQMRIFPYVKQDKTINGVVISFIEITTIKLAYKELQAAQDKLKKVNDELEIRVAERTRELTQAKEELSNTNDHLRKINTDLDNFVYTASHDLKAPISNIEALIINLVDILPKDNEELNQILGYIKLSIEKFKNTIKDLSEITKVQKEISEDIEIIDISEMIDDVCFNIRPLIEKSKAKILLDIKESQVRFSRKNLRSIIYNLLSNAIKYNSPNRTAEVRLSTERTDKFIVITASDNGLGIPENKKDKIFGMFTRVHHHIEGSGVGLYIVKRIVENSGGKIEVESRENEGTTFRIYLKGF